MTDLLPPNDVAALYDPRRNDAKIATLGDRIYEQDWIAASYKKDATEVQKLGADLWFGNGTCEVLLVIQATIQAIGAPCTVISSEDVSDNPVADWLVENLTLATSQRSWQMQGMSAKHCFREWRNVEIPNSGWPKWRVIELSVIEPGPSSPNDYILWRE